MSTLVRAVYESEQFGVERKSKDGSAFTLADGLVQALLVRLLNGTVGQIVGEEESGSLVQLDVPPPFRAGEHLEAPGALSPLITAARDEMDALAGRLHTLMQETPGAAAACRGLTAFIDPIDGTKEFSAGLGEQCTICIGFADASGLPLAGLVYRPLDGKAPTWALGCASAGLALSQLRTPPTPPPAPAPSAPPAGPRFLCSAGSLSAFARSLAEELGGQLAPMGGAGNKALLLLELEEAGAPVCYIQDRGLSRWDTCAAQAVLEAHGGSLAKLSPLSDPGAAATPPLCSYRYVRSELNADFESGLALLTKYNARGEPPPKGEQVLAERNEQILPYANTCGILALPASQLERLPEYSAAVRRAAARHPPAYD